MTHLKIQLKNVSEGGSVENVSGAVISALYNISKDPNLVFESSDLKGDLQVSGTYLKYANELHTQYPNLNITALSWYIYFHEPIIELYWANSEYGDGTGITIQSAQSVLKFPILINETLKTDFETNNIKDVEFSNGRWAFYKSDITEFNELGLFSNITKIPSGMFSNSNLNSIDLSNITEIGVKAFQSTKLSGIINLPKLNKFSSRDYNMAGLNSEGSQFKYLSTITEVNIGSNVLSGLKISKISMECFLECTLLAKVTGLEEVTTIESNAFRDTSVTNLSDLNPNLVNINASAFRNSPLICIDITKCIKINESAFNGCTSLLALDTNNPSEINNNDTYTLNWTTYDSNGFSIFLNCKLTNKTIVLPNLTTIPLGCFKGTNIKKVIAPNVTNLKGESFSGCSSLQELELGNVTIIDDNAFNNCSSLTTIKFGNLVNDFSNLTFIGIFGLSKSNLPNIILPSNINLPNLLTIKVGAFLNRTEITTISNLGSITSLGEGCFSGCTNLTSVTLPNTLTSFKCTVFNLTALTNIIGPEGITKFEISLFTGVPTMKYIEIPSTCTDMGNTFHRSFESSPGIDCRVVIKATTPPTCSYYNNNDIGASKSGANRYSGIYVPDASLSAYQSAGGAWELAEVKAKLKPISLLQKDSSYCWNKYLEGLNS